MTPSLQELFLVGDNQILKLREVRRVTWPFLTSSGQLGPGLAPPLIAFKFALQFYVRYFPTELFKIHIPNEWGR
jgi:hypothetical protein